MTVQAVFFDMGGTIETFGHTREQRLAATPVIQQFLMQAGIDLHLNDIQLYDVISGGLDRYKRWSIHSMAELPAPRIWSEFIFLEMDVNPDTLATAAEDLTVLVESQYYQRAMRPEVPTVLEAIQQMGLKIGLISNVSSQGLVPANLKKYGIFHYFSTIVLSSQYGCRKPDPAIFHHAARLANVPTSACLYIGDRIQRDIVGARRAGFGKAIQIKHNYAHGEDDTGAKPDSVIDNMTGLLDILRVDRDLHPSLPIQGKIRGVIFDAGDVLYYRSERGTKFLAFLNEFGINSRPDLEMAKKEIEYKAYRGQISHDSYREAILSMYGITHPGQVARGKQALIADDANVTFFEGVTETLLELKKRGYLLGIVTDTANSISAKLSWFERGGFGHIWDSIVTSMDLGTRKPDPKIYQAALRQLGLTPDQAVFVGHRTAELNGARAVGMATIAFNYDPDARADCYINRFTDLANVLAAEKHGNIR